MATALSSLASRFLARVTRSRGATNPTGDSVRERIHRLARANVEESLAEASDPEVAARELVTSFEQATTEARHAVQEAITLLRTTEAKQLEDEEAAQVWRQKAELASARATEFHKTDPAKAAASDELALKALKKERRLEIAIDSRRALIATQRHQVEVLKRDMEAMGRRFEELQLHAEQLVSRSRFAAAQTTVVDALREGDAANVGSKMSELDHEVRRREALAQGYSELAASSTEALLRELEEPHAEAGATLIAVEAGRKN